MRSFIASIWLILSAGTSSADEMRLAVTTSFHNSGLADLLVPVAKEETGIDLRLLVVGTGQALRLGRSGDVDAMLVHSKGAEEAFVADGHGTHRREIMYNDFVLVGPAGDPADAGEVAGIYEALSSVMNTGSLFVSRGDDSGTHRREQSYWRHIGLEPDTFEAAWYRAAGAGMGATLNVAAGMNAYVLTDRASWLNFANKGDLGIVFEGDEALYNQYAYLPVAVAKHPHVKADLSAKIEDWLVSEATQALIGSFKIDGQSLFTPNAEASGN